MYEKSEDDTVLTLNQLAGRILRDHDSRYWADKCNIVIYSNGTYIWLNDVRKQRARCITEHRFSALERRRTSCNLLVSIR